MRVTDISDISIYKDKISRLKDKQKCLAISVSLAAGLAWKKKVQSFYEIIAKEIKSISRENIADFYNIVTRIPQKSEARAGVKVYTGSSLSLYITTFIKEMPSVSFVFWIA